MKSLKIPKGFLVAVNRKRTERKTIIYKTLNRKKKDLAAHKNRGSHRCSERVNSFCSRYGTCRCTPVINPVVNYE